MLRGKVKFFDAREGKKFGFIVREDGEGEVFFHFNDGEFLKMGSESPEFTRSSTRIKNGQTYRLREPQKDDTLVFNLYAGNDQRYKASPWGYAVTYDKLVERMASLPIYRLIEQTGLWTDLTHPPTEKVLLEGTLSKLTKEGTTRDGYLQDSFSTLRYTHDDGFYTDRWFELKTETGWEKVENPFYKLAERGAVRFRL